MTDPQRGAVALLKAGAGLKGVRRPTLKALERDGYVVETDAGWTLTDAGDALFIEDAQRRNTAAQFREGDQVLHIDWDSRLRPHDSPMVLCKVVRVTASRVRIMDISTGLESTREPRSLVPPIAGDDTLFPVEDPAEVQLFIDSPAGRDVGTLQRVVLELAEYARGLLKELADRRTQGATTLTELDIYGGVESAHADDAIAYADDAFDGLADFVPVLYGKGWPR